MVQRGRATSDEAAFVREMKGRRENFGSEDIDQIKTYTAIELRLLARTIDRKSTRLNSSHRSLSRMPSSA